MKSLLLSQIVKYIAPEMIFSGDDVDINEICTDSRKVTKGCLFLAIAGEKFDGHDYIEEVCEKGAVAIVYHNENCKHDIAGVAFIKVQDTILALGDLARAYRQLYKIPVVGITGSVGKTTTKNFTAAAFSESLKTVKTPLNFNNEIGLPLTVLMLEDHEALIVEMGMRGEGEIEYLTNIAKPTIAIISNIGISHIERLKSRENIFLAKTEICHGLAEKGILLVNGDDDMLGDYEKLSKRVNEFNKKIQIITFGTSNNCDIKAENIKLGDTAQFDFVAPFGTMHIKLALPGKHNVLNALSALAAAYYSGISLAHAAKGVMEFQGDQIRQNIININGFKIIDDTYNAGPESMKAALDVLVSFKESKRYIAVLGSMLELGSYAANAHIEVGKHAGEIGVDLLIAVGKMAVKYAAEFTTQVYCLNENEQVLDILQKIIAPGDCILVKGSHAMHMDEIVEGLKKYCEGIK